MKRVNYVIHDCTDCVDYYRDDHGYPRCRWAGRILSYDEDGNKLIFDYECQWSDYDD